MKKSTTRISAILIAIVMLIGCSIGIISASASPNYNQDIVDSINEALKNYENKVKDGNIYTNTSDAYTKYVDLSRYLDRYYYGNESVSQSYINQAIYNLNTAVGNMQVWSGPGFVVKNNSITNASSDKVWSGDNAPWSTASQYYKNVIWSGLNYDNTTRASYYNGTKANGPIELTFQYPAYAVLLDGTATPQFPVMVYGHGTSTSESNGGRERRYLYAAYLKDTTNVYFDSLWVNPGGTTFDTTWIFDQGGAGSSHTYPLAAGAYEARIRDGGYTGNYKDDPKYQANIMKVNALGDGTFYKEVYPHLLGYITGKTVTGIGGGTKDITPFTADLGAGNQAIYLINYVPLKNALNSASVKSQMASVASYREGGLGDFFKALDEATAFDPNTYFTNSSVGTNSKNCADKIEALTKALTKTYQTDQYAGLRAAIDSARAKYFEDTTQSQGVGGTNPKSSDGLNYKYCTTPWNTFAAAYANTSTVMRTAGSTGSYNDGTNAAVLASQLNTALAAVKEHVAGSDKLYRIPDEGGYKKATCDADGLAVEYSMCPNCNEEHIDNTAYTVTSTGHTYKAYEGNDEATCTKEGVEPYWYCERSEDDLHKAGCGKYFEDNNGVVGNEISEPQPSPALGHDFGDPAGPWREGREATCFVGELKEIWHCSRCDKYFTKENVSETSEIYATDEDLQEGQPNPHVFEEHTPVDATCEHPGNLEYYSCKNCGMFFHSEDGNDVWNVETDGSPILPQLAHSFTVYEPNNDWSCTTNGTATAYCDYEKDQPKDEQATDTKIVKEAVGHVFGEDSKTERVIPDCITGGNVEYYTCDVCDGKYNTNNIWSVAEVPEDQLNIPATGVHTLGQHYEVKANCQTPGWDAYWECAVCHVLYDSNDQSTGNVIDDLKKWDGYYAKGEHVLIAHEAQKATCEVDGWDEYWECALCSKCYDSNDQSQGFEAFEENNKIADTVAGIVDWEDGYTAAADVPHSVGPDLATDATCVEPGYESHFECSECGKWFDSDGPDAHEIPAQPVAPINPDNHTGNWITNDKKDATCQKTGFKMANVQCKDCGYYYANTSDVTVADRLTNDQVIAPTVEHDQKDKVPTEIGSIAATCTAPGQQMYFLNCSMCGALQSATSEVTDKLPHEATTDEAIEGFAPTCQVAGEKDHFECKMCHQYFADTDSTCKGDPIDIVIATVPHDFSKNDEDHTVVVTAADCWNNAKVEYLCTFDCGTHSNAQERTDDGYGKLGHNFTTESSHAEKAATCLTDGNPEYYYCNRCDQNYSDNDSYTTNTFNGNLTVPATGHSFVVDKLGVAATCGKVGSYTSYVCSNENCDLTKEGVKAQFIYDAAKKTYKAIADASELVEPINEANHSGLHGYAATPANCATWEDGYDSYIYCSGCENYYRAYDHYGDTPLENGKEDLKVAPAHTLSFYKSEQPTCIDDGFNDVYVCDVCEQVFKDNTPDVQKGLTEEQIDEEIMIKAEGHTFGDYIVKEATCVVEGVAGHYECSVCNIAVICAEADKDNHSVKFFEGDDTEKLDLGTNENNHKNIVDGVSKAPTCLTDGVKAHKICEDCSTLFDVDGVTVITDTKDPATGHNYVLVETNAKAATCKEPGVKAHYECSNANCDLTVDGAKAKFIYDAETASYKQVTNDSELEIPKDPNNHVSLAYDPGEAANCETWTAGRRANYHCECGVYYELEDFVDRTPAKTADDFVIAPKHTLEDKGEQAATCLAEGYNHYWECTECGQYFLSDDATVKTGVDYDTDIKLDATGHKVRTEKENEVPGIDCQHKGTYEEVIYCDNTWCDLNGAAVSRETKESTEFGKHTPGEAAQENVVPAKCETAGSYDLVTRCTVCNDAIETEANQVIDPTGHKNGEAKIENEKKGADCQHFGTYEEVVYCVNEWCEVDGGKVLSRVEKETDVVGDHVAGTPQRDNVVEATCEKDGSCDLVTLCELCEFEITRVKDQVINKTDHKADKAKIENEKDGVDCKHHGTYDEVVYCENEWCDVKGGKELSRVQKETDKLGEHKAGEPKREDVVEAACTENGSYDLVTRCEVCNEELDRVKDQVITAKGHKWSDWKTVDSPNCVNGGSQKRTCTVCGVVETKNLKPNGHVWEKDYTIDVAPTCTTQGSKSIHCAKCDAQKDSVPVSALGHDWIIDKAVKPTATKPGLTQGKHCSRCDAKVEQEVIPATGEIKLEILEGANLTYVIGSNEAKTIRCSGYLNKFIELLLEGEHVDEANYILKDGSTIVTFKPEYLNTLAPGVYKVTLVYTYDSIDTTLTVVEKSTETSTEKPTETPTEAPTEKPTEAPSENTTEATTQAPAENTTKPNTEATTGKDKAPVSNNSSTSPGTGFVLSIPVLSLAALAGGSFFLGYARKKKNEDEE